MVQNLEKKFPKNFIYPYSVLICEPINLFVIIIVQNRKIKENIKRIKVLNEYRTELQVEDVGEFIIDKILHIFYFFKMKVKLIFLISQF